jgi:large subunit ribosomal protein L9
MEVILLERIERLGQMGDVVRVKPGYARNYLLPQKKALRSTPENRAYFEAQRAQLEAVNLDQRTEATAVAEKLEGLSVVLIRQAGEGGQLYGSVTTRDVTAALEEAGVTVERRQIQLDRPIKALGLYNIRVSLHPEVAIAVTINVAKTEEEAKAQVEAARAAAEAEEAEAAAAKAAEREAAAEGKKRKKAAAEGPAEAEEAEAAAAKAPEREAAASAAAEGPAEASEPSPEGTEPGAEEQTPEAEGESAKEEKGTD